MCVCVRLCAHVHVVYMYTGVRVYAHGSACILNLYVFHRIK